ncbi:MAG: glutamate-cysteine ligase family protein [Gemmatimonadetes bacterium]|nr:glutamate-cysteine ligase family protein [Gemmatimonadota bacterium]
MVLHVFEFKTNGPAPTLSGLGGTFHDSMLAAQNRLSDLGARLMPGAMHPWMNPETETRLWPHEDNEVYRTFDRIFGCKGHGWANLQSTHLNLPFANDEEFGRLHAAIRVALPLIPALSAASPYVDGRGGGALDTRMAVYRGNARRVPSVSGQIIPEPAFTRDEYQRTILARIYADLEPHDPAGILRHEWVNARGAIARFDRGAIEIRIIDAQECPAADLAVVAAVVTLVRSLSQGRLAGRDVAEDPSTESLAAVLDAAVRDGERAELSDPALLRVLGMPSSPLALGEVWRRLLEADPLDDPAGEWTHPLGMILSEGPLARRMLRAAGTAPTLSDLRRVALDLCGSLVENSSFSAT